jgi:hypothetical protein
MFSASTCLSLAICIVDKIESFESVFYYNQSRKGACFSYNKELYYHSTVLRWFLDHFGWRCRSNDWSTQNIWSTKCDGFNEKVHLMSSLDFTLKGYPTGLSSFASGKSWTQFKHLRGQLALLKIHWRRSYDHFGNWSALSFYPCNYWRRFERRIIH